MKRDMELVRKILFFLEEQPMLKAQTVLPIEGYEEEVIMYHMLLLAQAGLVDFEPEKTQNGRIIRAHVLGLNWAGHEFLDTIRSEKVWKKLVRYAAKRGGALPFDLLKVLGAELLKRSIE
jgi:DNA-binding transcriptional ArsR family regulator